MTAPAVEVPFDAEALAVGYLRTVPAVTDLADARISTRFPAGFPRTGRSLRVLLVGHRSSDTHGHLQTAHLQVSGYGLDENDGVAASALTRTAYAALLAMPAWIHTDVVVTAVTTTLPIVADPDEPTGAAGYRFGVMVHGHRRPGR